MPISWFDASEAKKFGFELAHFFIERIPFESTAKKDKSLAKKKEVLDKMFARIAQFKQQHKLNIYKKAQLGNTFKWELSEAGYDEEFVDDLTKMLMKLF
jgi:hypothetical protein